MMSGLAARALGDIYDGLGIHVASDRQTPARVVRWLETLAGKPPTFEDCVALLEPVFEDPHKELVMVKDIRFIAACEHHLLPFSGKAAIGYVPDGRIVGLSKTARLLELFTRIPTLQEHVTSGVCDALQQVIKPQGSMVVLYDVMHSCISMRGVKDAEAVTTTSAVRGIFNTDSIARQEFLSLLR